MVVDSWEEFRTEAALFTAVDMETDGCLCNFPVSLAAAAATGRRPTGTAAG